MTSTDSEEKKTPEFSMASFWEQFKEQTIPSDANQIQITEMERAYFAGAHALMFALGSVDNLDVTEEQSNKLISDIMQEIAAFKASLEN